jgi:hypothetical protein
MDRQAFTLTTPLARSNCARALVDAPDGSRVEIKGPRRSVPQNSRMWAALTDVSRQLEHGGRLYEPDEWKFIFLQAFGKETRFLPALDGKSFVPIPQSSSDLSTKEMSDFNEFIYAEGLQRGVVFSDPPPKAWRRDGEAA